MPMENRQSVKCRSDVQDIPETAPGPFYGLS
jgi:hypothetical protein